MFKLFLPFIAMVFFLGCGYVVPKPDVSNAKMYHYAGVNFEYPANWKVESDKQYEKARITKINSAGYAGMNLYYASTKLEDNLGMFAEVFSKGINEKSSKENIISTEVRIKAESEDGYEVIIGTHSERTPKITMEFTRIYKYKVIQGVHCYIVSYSPTKDMVIEKSGHRLIASSLAFDKE